VWLLVLPRRVALLRQAFSGVRMNSYRTNREYPMFKHLMEAHKWGSMAAAQFARECSADCPCPKCNAPREQLAKEAAMDLAEAGQKTRGVQ
jgi:hypothetical protein